MAKKRKLDPKSQAAASSAASAAADEQPLAETTETLAEGQAPTQTLDQEDGHGETLAQDGRNQSLDQGEDGGDDKDEQEQEEEEEHDGDEDEDEDEESDPASIQALLDSFPKDQLVELLRDAAVAHGDVLAAVRGAADADPAQRKIFVHGLGWDANADTLSAAFSPYGDIEDLKVVADRATGKCKGYGFILFRRRSGARRALREPQKKIGNRTAACQLASVGPVPQGGTAATGAAHPAAPAAPHAPPGPPVSEYTQRKIFVSNVGAEVDPQKLLQFFARYGEIEEGPLGLDKVTGKPKGFALFVYKSIESARKALEEPHKNFEGIVLHCQKAIDGPKPNKGGGFYHGAGASGGRKGGSGYGAGSHQVPGGPSAGHMMAPQASGLAAQPAAMAGSTGLNPALGQALTAFLATQGTGLGLNNLLGAVGANGMGTPVGNQAVSGALGGTAGPGIQGGYGNPSMMGGYGGPGQMQGGYGNAPQSGAGRNYMGH